METSFEMRVLVACEESQEVCKAFRALGHEAYSNDLQVAGGGYPQWHLQMDMFEALDKYGPWNLVIAFPDCRYLCWSGELWMTRIPGRPEARQKAFEFFKRVLACHVPLCVENSLSLFLERNGYKPTQKVHPFHFGDPFRKTTCLWLRGLKPLIPTNITFKREPACHMGHGKKHGDERRKLRAKTYPGIARAMAEQWGGKVEEVDTQIHAKA